MDCVGLRVERSMKYLVFASLLLSPAAFAQANIGAWCEYFVECRSGEPEDVADCIEETEGNYATYAADPENCGGVAAAEDALQTCELNGGCAANCNSQLQTWLALFDTCISAQSDVEPAPEGWHCPDEFYADNDCDCGCGIPDPTCNGAGTATSFVTTEACGHCYDEEGEELENCDDLPLGTPDGNGNNGGGNGGGGGGGGGGGEGEGEGEGESPSGCPFNAAGAFPALGVLAMMMRRRRH